MQRIEKIPVGSIVHYYLEENADEENIRDPMEEWKGRVKQFIPVHPAPELSVVIVEVLKDDPVYNGEEDYILLRQIVDIEQETQPK